jgi:hypothetical protein
LTRVDRAFAGCARLLRDQFPEAVAFSFLTPVRRAFRAALFFGLHAVESPCLFRGAAFIAWTVDCPPITADSRARFFCKFSLPVLVVDQTSGHLSVMAPGAITLQMAIGGGVVGEFMMRSKA